MYPVAGEYQFRDSNTASLAALARKHDMRMDGEKTFTQAEVDAAIAANEAGLKANQAELIKEAKQAKAKLAAYDGVDPEKYRQLVAASEEAEKKRLQGEGDFKQLEAQLVTKYEGELEKERGVSTRYRSAVERNLIDAAVATELAKHSDTPGLLLPHVRGQMKVIEQDGEFHARIVDAAGNVRIGKGQGSTPMTLPELVDEMKGNATFAPAFRGSGASGGGATRSNAGGGGVRTITLNNPMDLITYAADIASGKVVVQR